MENEEYTTDSIFAIRWDQLVSMGDLQRFKEELLVEIRKLLPQVTSHSQKKLLKSKNVRKLLSLSPGTLQNLRTNGSLPFIKIGGVI